MDEDSLKKEIQIELNLNCVNHYTVLAKHVEMLISPRF